MIDQNRDPALDEALELFFYGFRAFTALPDQVLAQRGLQRVHHRVLYFVGRHPRLSVNALLGILAVSKQALNAPLRQLVERGLIAVEVASHDRRVRELTLTEDGSQLEAALSAAQHALMGKVFAEVGPQAEQQWKTVMRALAAR